MTQKEFDKAVAAICALHHEDRQFETHQGKQVPAEWVYALRMQAALNDYVPGASFALQLAAQCHHLKRWEVARTQFAMNKSGYFMWRQTVLAHQIKLATQALLEAGVEQTECDGVCHILQSKHRNILHEAQLLEDVACAVFVRDYLEPFAAKHPEEKVVDIIRKTLQKVSDPGKAYIGGLTLSHKVNAYLALAR